MAIQFFPRKAPQFDPKVIREFAKTADIPYVVRPNGRRFAVLAVRGWYADKNARGVYDDAIFLLFDDRIDAYVANTDPSAWTVGRAALAGASFTNNRRVSGTGELWLRPGKHKVNFPPPRGYAAFRQVRDCVVWRGDSFDRGNFGINLHRGGYKTTSSLGCQTIHPVQWEKFKRSIQKEFGVDDSWCMKNPYGVKAHEFCYLLVNHIDFEKITS